MITTDIIIEYLENAAKNNQVIDIDSMLNAASKLNILLGGEHETLFMLQQQVAKEKSGLIADGMSVAKANAEVEASDGYREMQTQKARIGRIEELIRITKLQAKLRAEELRNY